MCRLRSVETRGQLHGRFQGIAHNVQDSIGCAPELNAER